MERRPGWILLWAWVCLGLGLYWSAAPTPWQEVSDEFSDILPEPPVAWDPIEDPPSTLAVVPLVEPPPAMAALAEQAWLAAGVCPVQVVGIVAGDTVASRIAYMLHHGERKTGQVGQQWSLGTGVAVIEAIGERVVRLSYQGQELTCPLQWR